MKLIFWEGAQSFFQPSTARVNLLHITTNFQFREPNHNDNKWALQLKSRDSHSFDPWTEEKDLLRSMGDARPALRTLDFFSSSF